MRLMRTTTRRERTKTTTSWSPSTFVRWQPRTLAHASSLATRRHPPTPCSAPHPPDHFKSYFTEAEAAEFVAGAADGGALSVAVEAALDSLFQADEEEEDEVEEDDGEEEDDDDDLDWTDPETPWKSE